MKKYKLTWYAGDIEARHISEIYNEVETEAETIDKVNLKLVLPNSISKNVGYYRCLLLADTKIIADYGSYSKFILVEELK